MLEITRLTYSKNYDKDEINKLADYLLVVVFFSLYNVFLYSMLRVIDVKMYRV